MTIAGRRPEKTMKTSTYLVILYFLFNSTFANAQESEYLMPAKKYGLWGFINIKGEWIIDATYEEAFYFSEGLAAVRYVGHWGYIDRHSQWIIKPTFTDAKPFGEGLACVMQDNKWGFIDKKGNWQIEPKLTVVSSFTDGMALVNADNGYTFINKNNAQVLNHTFSKALPFAEGLAFVVFNKNKGYIERSGNWLIRHNYDEAYSFSDGLALVKSGSGYGFIDQKGQFAIPAVYADANYFRDGLAAVKKRDSWGYINLHGEYAIESRFDAAFPFSNNYAVVKLGGKYGLIDKRGEWIIQPTFSGLGRYTMAVSLEEQIAGYVKSMYTDWQLKGEFEKTQDYMARVSKGNRDAQIQRFSSDAIQSIARRSVNFGLSTVGLYDADNEKFNMYVPGARSLMIPIPMENAKEIKDNWENVWIGNHTFTVSGDEFVITSMSLKYQGKEFLYDIADDKSSTVNSSLDLAFSDLPENLPLININSAPNLTVIGQSDVDVNIPVTGIKNDKTFALIIGNEDYGTYQMDLNPSSNVDFATTDARTFKKYLVNTMGVPEENITLLINGTSGQMKQSVARLSAIAAAYEGEARLIFYYAGHGLPKEDTQEPYIIPVDVSASNLDYALKLEDVYNKLCEHPSERVTVFLDACFTGGARNQGLVAARGVRIKPKSPFVLGNLIVLAATSEDQTAHPYVEKAHGIFTYYLLKGLQISNGAMSYGELEDFVRTNVMRKSVLVNNKLQTPEAKVSPVFEYTWKDMLFVPDLKTSSTK